MADDAGMGEVEYEATLALIRAQRLAWQRQIQELQQKVKYSEEAEMAILLMRVNGSQWPAGKPLIDGDTYIPAIRNELAHSETAAKGQVFINRMLGGVRQPSPKGSTVRVAEIVDASANGMTAQGLYEAFKERGWIDADWAKPESAVAQAARRAADRGMIVRLSDGKFVSHDWVRAYATNTEGATSGASDPAIGGGGDRA